jgi:hypothetical protein
MKTFNNTVLDFTLSAIDTLSLATSVTKTHFTVWVFNHWPVIFLTLVCIASVLGLKIFSTDKRLPEPEVFYWVYWKDANLWKRHFVTSAE